MPQLQPPSSAIPIARLLDPTAQMFYAFLILAAALKCFSLSRRRRTNSKCTTGLGLIFLGFFLSWIGTTFAEMPDQPQLAALFKLVAAAAVFTGGILAVIGLSEFKKADPPYLQGRAQAIGGLVIIAVILLGAIATYALRMDRFRQGESKPQIHKEFNLSFGPPPAQWYKADPKVINEEALLVYRHANPEIYFMLIAESGVYNVGMDTDRLREAAKSYLLGVDENSKITDGADIQQGTLTFYTFSTKAKVQNTAFAYNHSVTTHNGYAYQLITFGKASIAKKVDAAAKTMLERFRLLDPDHMDLGESGSLVGKYGSSRFGFSLDLSDGHWFTNASLREDVPKSTFIASLVGSAWITVIPIVLDEQDPPLEASLQSFLSMQGFEYPSQPIRDRKTHDSDAKHEITFSYTGSSDAGETIATCRIVQKNGLIYYIEGGCQKEDQARRGITEEAVRRVRFTTPLDLPDLHAMDTSEKSLEALFFNEVGNHFYAQQALGKAKEYFMLASALKPDDVNVIENVNVCLFELNAYEEALRFLNQKTPYIGGSKVLLADKAWLLAWAGQDFEAMKLYARLFKDGLEDVEHLSAYLSALERQDRIDDALLLVTQFRKKADSPLLQARNAKLLVTAKRPQEAIRLLIALPTPRHPKVSIALVAAYEADKKLSDALVVASNLLTNGYASAVIYHTKARIEKELGQLDTAAETAALGLLHYERNAKLMKLSAEIQKLLKKN